MLRRFILMIMVLGLAVLNGCTRYPQVPVENLEYIAALRTACNTRSEQRLNKVEEVIRADHSQRKLTDDSLSALTNIIAMARSGDWSAAEQECYRFQSDQLAK